MEYRSPIDHCLLTGSGKDLLVNQAVIRAASNCLQFTYIESPQSLPNFFTQNTSAYLPNWIFIDLTDRWIEIHILFALLLKYTKKEPVCGVVLISDGNDSILVKLLSNAGIPFSLLPSPLTLPSLKKVFSKEG